MIDVTEQDLERVRKDGVPKNAPRTSQLSAQFMVTRHMAENAKVDLVAHGKERKDMDMGTMIMAMVNDGRAYVVEFGDWYQVDDLHRDFTEYVRHGFVALVDPMDAQVGELVHWNGIARHTEPRTDRDVVIGDGPEILTDPDASNWTPGVKTFRGADVHLSMNGTRTRIFQRVT